MMRARKDDAAMSAHALKDARGAAARGARGEGGVSDDAMP